MRNKTLKKILSDPNLTGKLPNFNSKTSRNKFTAEFPQPGSFASIQGFGATEFSTTPLMRDDLNFVYHSPRNKNSLVKFKAITSSLNNNVKEFGRRNAILVDRHQTSLEGKPKVYNKVTNQRKHNSSNLIDLIIVRDKKRYIKS